VALSQDNLSSRQRNPASLRSQQRSSGESWSSLSASGGSIRRLSKGVWHCAPFLAWSGFP
jgi:hypothetical protein